MFQIANNITNSGPKWRCRGKKAPTMSKEQTIIKTVYLQVNKNERKKTLLKETKRKTKNLQESITFVAVNLIKEKGKNRNKNNYVTKNKKNI